MRLGLRHPARLRLQPVDAYLAISLAGCLYALIVYPLLLTSCEFNDGACLLAPRPENRFVWPLLAAFSGVVVFKNWQRIFLPPHIICLLAYLAFAGLSVAWAFRPEISLVRYSQQVMVVVAVFDPPVPLTVNVTV